MHQINETASTRRRQDTHDFRRIFTTDAKVGRVASDATFPEKRDHASVGDADRGHHGNADAPPGSEPAGQDRRVNTDCIRGIDDVTDSVALGDRMLRLLQRQDRSDEGRCPVTASCHAGQFSMRATMLSTSFLNGMPPHIAQLILGHHDINTTEARLSKLIINSPERPHDAGQILHIRTGEPVSRKTIWRHAAGTRTLISAPAHCGRDRLEAGLADVLRQRLDPCAAGSERLCRRTPGLSS